MADRAATDPLGECRMPEGKGFVRATTLPFFPSLMGESIQRLFMDMRVTTLMLLLGMTLAFTQVSTGKDKREFNKKRLFKHERKQGIRRAA